MKTNDTIWGLSKTILLISCILAMHLQSLAKILIRNCVGGITPFYLVIFLLLASVMSSVHCLAQWSANPALNNAICTAVDNQNNTTITSDGNGGAIITWLDFRGGAFYDIYAQRIDADGVIRWTSDGVAICTASGDQSFQTITPDGIGGAIITWQDNRTVNGLYAQRINGAGVTQWASDGVQICTGTIRNPMIISDGIGGAIITWQDFRSGNVDIYAQRINAGGTVQWTSNGLAICTAANIQRYPTITSDGSSGAIIVWEDARNGINNHIYAQGINANGTVKWTNDGIAICTAPTENFAPTIISDGSAGAIVTWYTNLFVTPTDGNDIYAQRINASGVVQWIANGVAICKATGDQYQPVIISDGSAGAIISWTDQRSGTDVYAQRIDANGTLQWTTDGAAICTATNTQSFPTIASDGGAGAIITWYDFRSGANSDIYAQRINASGGLQWTTDGVAVSTAGGDQTLTSIISNSNAESIITWQDTRNGSGYDIYAQHVNANGSLATGSQTITAFTSPSGPIGTTVVITGTNFSTTPTDNTVMFNGTTAVVTTSTTTSITTTVPVGATTGKITVTVAGNTATSATDFTVTAISVITINPQPSSTVVCDGATAIFTLTASGTTNLAYQWQFSTSLAGTFNDIGNVGGYSNVATATLSVNTTGNFGAGFYRCKVSGDLAVTVFTNAAELTVNAIPSAPSATGSSTCNSGSVLLTASGGSNGQYRWYTTSTGGLAIGGQTNNAYTTPVITSTTLYYVAINNGTCESLRTPVTATVSGPCNQPPVISTTSLQAKIEGTVTLRITDLLSDPDNNLDLATLKIVQPPKSGASASIDSDFTLILNYFGVSFAGNDELTLEVCDLGNACVQQKLSIEVTGSIIVYNAVSPNGDDKNPAFILKYIEVLSETKKNKVSIYNRWGDEVFSMVDYDNKTRVFVGLTNNGTQLPSGTYFYKIVLPNAGKTLTGFLDLKY